MKQLEPLIAKEQKLSVDYREASSAGDTAKVKQIEKDFEAINNTMKEDVLIVYVKNNPASPIALFALQNTIGGEVARRWSDLFLIICRRPIRNRKPGWRCKRL